jgi:hypothetical protein
MVIMTGGYTTLYVTSQMYMFLTHKCGNIAICILLQGKPLETLLLHIDGTKSYLFCAKIKTYNIKAKFRLLSVISLELRLITFMCF